MDASSPDRTDALCIRLELLAGEDEPLEYCFDDSFHVGRGASCDLQVDEANVSRRHVRFVLEEERWHVRDLGSAAGTYLEGKRVRRAPLMLPTTVQLGREGPLLKVVPLPSQTLAPEDSPPSKAVATSPNRVSSTRPSFPKTHASGTEEPAAHTLENKPPGEKTSSKPTETPPGQEPYVHTVHVSTSPPEAAPDDFDNSGTGCEEARSEAATKKRRNDVPREDFDHSREALPSALRTTRGEQALGWALAATLLVLLVLGAFSFWQGIENRRLRRQLHTLDADLQRQGMQVMRLRELAEENGSGRITDQLARLSEQRREMGQRYDGYVQELGLNREMDARERAIHRMARIFNESDFEMPAQFVRRVRREINDYWLEEGRSRFVEAIERANENGYTGYIVDTMREHGLPPEFFYLALQESDFRKKAVGPPTRWGIAKGMWQFIPRTARAYGLRVGPRAQQPVVDLKDERHDFEKSTQAAADYLRHIYATRARTSGLLVIASYNWGEHRVNSEIGRMPGPQAIPEQAVDDLLSGNDDLLSYWSFLTVHRDRLPEQTRDYVIKVFAAAVIGDAPRLFGFDFDNPLTKHLKTEKKKPPLPSSLLQETSP